MSECLRELRNFVWSHLNLEISHSPSCSDLQGTVTQASPSLAPPTFISRCLTSEVGCDRLLQLRFSENEAIPVHRFLPHLPTLSRVPVSFLKPAAINRAVKTQLKRELLYCIAVIFWPMHIPDTSLTPQEIGLSFGRKKKLPLHSNYLQQQVHLRS